MAVRFKNPFSIGSPAVGKFITVDADGNLTWATPAGGSSLPDQTGHAGEFLTTDGSTASWSSVSGSGVTTVGTLDSQTKSDNGLVISGSNIYAQSADEDKPGLLTNDAQRVFGEKSFLDFVNTTWLNTYNIFSAGDDVDGYPVQFSPGNGGHPLVIWGGQDGGGTDSSGAVIVRNSQTTALTQGYLQRWANGGTPPTHTAVAGMTYDGVLECAGVSSPNLGGILHSEMVDTGFSNTQTNSTLEDYFSYTLPAGNLEPGEYLRIRGAVSCTATNVRKRMRLLLGSTTIADHDVSNAAVWIEFEGTVTRNTAGTNTWMATIQKFNYVSAGSSGVSGHDISVGTDSFADTIAFKLQAGITNSAGTMVGRKFLVERVRLY